MHFDQYCSPRSFDRWPCLLSFAFLQFLAAKVTDLVIAYQQNGQLDEAKQAAKRLLAARRDFTIASWLKTQFRRDAEQLDADVAALRRTSHGLGTASATNGLMLWSVRIAMSEVMSQRSGIGV